MTAPLSSPDPAAGSHPEVDELADLAEDLLAPADADALRRHLTGCAECRETVEALAEVRTLLAGAEPPAMPADVAARLDAALAAAAQDAPATAPAPPAVPSEAPSKASPTAPPNAPHARPAAATGPGRTAHPRRRRTLVLGSAAALLALGLGGAFLALPGSSQQRDDARGTVAAKADRSPGATVYQEEQLAAQVRKLLAGATAERPDRPRLPVKPSAGAGAADPSDGSDGSGVTAVPPAEGGQGLTGGARATPACPPPSTAALLATDLGSYAGAPAELLVYALPGRSDQVDVYLRSPDCRLLLHRTVAAG
ncbi:hypothetical protein GCM10009639_15460 [Kitasatospora putterlickiae]|uniref:Zinc-finger domain-containing protein n=1 Tax=Kitasatospora putterlickiae TaxID=221725 RepID=A0ABP4IKG4_9ACTN